jgi:hypothetical protein
MYQPDMCLPLVGVAHTLRLVLQFQSGVCVSNEKGASLIYTKLTSEIFPVGMTWPFWKIYFTLSFLIGRHDL